MKCDKKYMLLYAVTDRTWVGEKTLYQQVEEALRGGVTCVQLREKDMRIFCKRRKKFMPCASNTVSPSSSTTMWR